MPDSRLAETVVQQLLVYLDEGIPATDIRGMRPQTAEAIRIAEEMVERIGQDYMLDRRATLRHVYGCYPKQVARIEAIIDMMLERRSRMSRSRAQFIVDHAAEEMIRIGRQTSDPHPIEAGARLLVKTHQLDQSEPPADQVQNTYVLPTVLVPIEQIDPNKRTYSRQEKLALMRKYGASEDAMSVLIQDKVRLREQELGAAMLEEPSAAEEADIIKE